MHSLRDIILDFSFLARYCLGWKGEFLFNIIRWLGFDIIFSKK